MYFIQRRIKMS